MVLVPVKYQAGSFKETTLVKVLRVDVLNKTIISIHGEIGSMTGSKSYQSDKFFSVRKRKEITT